MKKSQDEALRDKIRGELAWDSRIDASQVDVSVSDGVVTVVGAVGSYAEKLAVEAAIGVVGGGHDLIDDIVVKPHAEAHPDDTTLVDMARQVLAWDALVPEDEITVQATDGHITLTGSVDVGAQRHEAERALAHLTGLRGITNDIQVVDSDLEPNAIRHAIADALRRRAEHRANRIDVVIDGRAVTLRGPVQTRHEKTAILGAISHAPGIARVSDELRIDPTT